MNPGTAGCVGYTPPVSRATPARPGWFITLEGPEGAGKTHQAAKLRSALLAGGLEVTATREPGGTPIGERIRSLLLELNAHAAHDPRTDALLFNAARAELVTQVIRPALARGDVVLCSRFADSTVAYQGYGGGIPVDDLRVLERLATGGLEPDLTILLDLPPDVGLARKSRAEVNRFEAAFDLAFHERVRDGFIAIARSAPERFAVVDATPPEEAVFAAVRAAVAARLPTLARAAGWADGRSEATERGVGEPERPGVRTT